ncbi:MAG: oligosaccharide flippase family protein, partial [Patescibacteria group bacterium]
YQLSVWVLTAGGAVLPIYIGKYPGPGIWTGAQAVGFAIFATGLAGFTRIFMEIIARVTIPVLSRSQSDKKIVAKTLEKVLETTALTSFGLMAVTFVFAEEIITFFYTAKWLPAASFLRLQLVQSAEMAVGLILTNALLSLGLSGTYRNLNILWALLQWTLTIPLVSVFGFNGFGVASILVSATGIFLPFMFLKKRVQFAFWSKFLPSLGVSLLTGWVFFQIKNFVRIDNLLHLGVLGFLGLSFYTVCASIVLKKTIMTNARYFLALIKKA